MKPSILRLIVLGSCLSMFFSCKKDKINNPPSANAGLNAAITLPRDTITLYGSGSDVDGSIVSYLWSRVSGASSATIASATSASTQVGNLKEGVYVFQLTVFDEDGATGSDTVSIVVSPSLIQTLELSPDNNIDEVHIIGNNSGFDQTHPGAPEIGAAAWTNGSTVFMRAVLKFDLSSIPQDAVITSAALTLYSNHTPINGNQVDANYGADNSFLILQNTSSWSSSTVNFSNLPSFTTNRQVLIPSTTESFLDLPNIDVTEMISDMVASNKNYGFLIKLQSESLYTSRIFCSSKYSDASRHPKLIVTYSE